MSELNSGQRERCTSAIALFRAEKFGEALKAFKEVLPDLGDGAPAQVFISKYASEAAIDSGDDGFALTTLTPIEARDPNDWQAAALLARVYAETGKAQQRDAEIAHLVDLHQRAVSEQIAKMQQFLLERIPTKNGSVRVWYSLEPWGNYKIYVFARVYDAPGQQVLRVTLESADFDQPQFAKEHPDLAAKGARRFSLDGYGQEQKLPNGSMSGTHFTYKFYDGQPTYDEVRKQVIQVADGQVQAMSHTETQRPAAH